MKLRIRSQSVRFRLSPDDIEALGRGEIVKALNFGPEASFVYGLVPADISHVSVEAGGPVSWSSVQSLWLPRWLRRMMSLRTHFLDRGIWSVLVEKDFQCLIPGRGRR